MSLLFTPPLHLFFIVPRLFNRVADMPSTRRDSHEDGSVSKHLFASVARKRPSERIGDFRRLLSITPPDSPTLCVLDDVGSTGLLA
jgi:hypothetical protein